MNTINKYRKDRGQNSISAAASDNWKGVEMSVNEACHALVQIKTEDEDVEGFSYHLKQAFRDPGNNIGIANFITSFIPSSFMFSTVLCAGLRTVFLAMARAGYRRNVVYSALEELPSLLNDSTVHMGILGADKDFHHKIAALYASTLKLLRSILKWFIANPTGKHSCIRNVGTRVHSH